MTRSAAASHGIAKRYGATVALDGVDLAVRAGEVHALLGENGAGKSTLMGVLAGAVRADRGEMTLDGAHVRAGRRRTMRVGAASRSSIRSCRSVRT